MRSLSVVPCCNGCCGSVIIVYGIVHSIGLALGIHNRNDITRCQRVLHTTVEIVISSVLFAVQWHKKGMCTQ